MKKVVLFDAGFFGHRAILAFSKTMAMTIGYTYLNMLTACLKRIGVGYDDLVLLCKDSHNSWRKDYYSEYKSNRAAGRAKQENEDFWNEAWKEVDQINEKILMATNWHLVKAERLEADDLISEACRAFQGCDITIVSIDSDLKQLCALPNVRFFTKTKVKSKKEWVYVDVENPIEILKKKITSGDKSDNISKPKNEHDLQIRNKIINLLELPEDISNKAKEVLINLPVKNFNWSKLPYRSIKNSLWAVYEVKKEIK